MSAEALTESVEAYRAAWAERLPPYGAALLENNIYEAFPLDGGAWFIFRERLGGLDDARIAGRVFAGEALADWGGLDELDFAALDRWDVAEHAMWLQRLYLLPVLAKHWRLTKSDAALAAAKALLFGWIEAHPLPEDLPAYLHEENERFKSQGRAPGPYLRSWYDFQPANRAVVISWFLHLAGEALDEREWETILCSLADHGRALLANYRAWPDRHGNHQTWIAVGLCYLASLLREEPWAAGAAETGFSILREYAEKLVNPDGLSKEASPSYQLFTMMHFREGWALAKRLGRPAPMRQERIERMHEAVRLIAQPDNTSPLVNDGYAADCRPALALAARLFRRADLSPRIAPDPKSKKPVREAFPETGFGLLRNGFHPEDSYVLLDASRTAPVGKASHHHAGKLGFVYWSRGAQIVGDSGTGPYNAPLFGSWFRRGGAHSSVLVDGREDSEFLGEWEWETLPATEIVALHGGPGYQYVEGRNDGFRRLADPVGFRRRLILFADGALAVWDTLNAGAAHEYAFVFRMASGTAGQTGAGVRLVPDGHAREANLLLPLVGEFDIAVGADPWFGAGGAHETPTVTFSANYTGTLEAAFVFLPLVGEQQIADERALLRIRHALEREGLASQTPDLDPAR